MSYTRNFIHNIGGEPIEFDVTYNTENHFFKVQEAGLTEPYLLKFDMSSRVWSIESSQDTKISAEELALLVQKHFGRTV